MSTYGNIKFDKSRVNSVLYEDAAAGGYPTIVWHGKYTGGADSGYWTLDRSESQEAPGPFWEESQVRFGSSPSTPLSDVWKTERLRVCVLGVRKRILIYGEDGGQYSYPWMTPKADRVPGQYKAHIQAAVTLPGTGERIFQIGLKGVSKTKAWTNPESGRFHDSKFPKGAELVLRDLVSMASQEAGAEIPLYCSFWLDLVPHLNDKGQRAYIDIGHGTHVAVFAADISSGGETGLDHRFVGMELFEAFQEIRVRELLDWEDAWSKETMSGRENGSAPHPYDSPEIIEEDGEELGEIVLKKEKVSY